LPRIVQGAGTALCGMLQPSACCDAVCGHYTGGGHWVDLALVEVRAWQKAGSFACRLCRLSCCRAAAVPRVSCCKLRLPSVMGLHRWTRGPCALRGRGHERGGRGRRARRLLEAPAPPAAALGRATRMRGVNPFGFTAAAACASHRSWGSRMRMVFLLPRMKLPS
jgi:hypothetical protein